MKLFVFKNLLSFIFAGLEDIISRTSFIRSILFKGVAVFKKTAVFIGLVLFRCFSVFNKKVLACLLISCCFCFNVYGNDHEPSSDAGETRVNTKEGSGEGSNEGGDPIPVCEDATDEAVQECQGMGMAEYAAVGSATTTAASQGSSASTAHKGNALMHGALGAVSSAKCSKCESAINSCETACDKEKCSKKYNQATQQEELARCKERLREEKKDCIELESYRKQFCLQAVLSGAQALMSLLAAKKLQDGSDNEDEGEEKEKDELNIPTMPEAGENFPFNMTGPSWDENKNGPETEPLKIPENDSEEKDTKEDTEDTEGTEETEETLDALGGLGGIGSSSGSGSQAFDYGKRASSGSGSGMLTGDETEEEYEEEKGDAYPKAVFSRSAGFGGSDKAGYPNSALTGYGGSHNGRGLNSDKLTEDRKIAMNEKKDTFGKGKEGDSIFKQTSQMIQNFCYGENRCPLVKKK